MDLPVSYLLNLPNDTLLRDILPKIPLSTLTEACSLHPRINQLCQLDKLWQDRTAFEFFKEYNNKPLDISWRDYYLLLTGNKIIPVYLGNDQIDSIMFVPRFFELTLKRLLPNLTNIQQPYYIVFSDNDNMPYYMVREPENTISILSENYRNISKATIIQS